jgi:hypothetical protein
MANVQLVHNPDFISLCIDADNRQDITLILLSDPIG